MNKLTVIVYLLGFAIFLEFGGKWLLAKILPKSLTNPSPEADASSAAPAASIARSDAIVDNAMEQLEDVRQASAKRRDEAHVIATAAALAAAATVPSPSDASDGESDLAAASDIPMLQDVIPDDVLQDYAEHLMEAHNSFNFEDNDRGALA